AEGQEADALVAGAVRREPGQSPIPSVAERDDLVLGAADRTVPIPAADRCDAMTPITPQLAEPLEPRVIRQLQAQVAAELSRETQRREAQGEPELTRADEQQYAITLIQQAVGEHMQRRLRDAEDVPVDRT